MHHRLPLPVDKKECRPAAIRQNLQSLFLLRIAAGRNAHLRTKPVHHQELENANCVFWSLPFVILEGYPFSCFRLWDGKSLDRSVPLRRRGAPVTRASRLDASSSTGK